MFVSSLPSTVGTLRFLRNHGKAEQLRFVRHTAAAVLARVCTWLPFLRLRSVAHECFFFRTWLLGGA